VVPMGVAISGVLPEIKGSLAPLDQSVCTAPLSLPS